MTADALEERVRRAKARIGGLLKEKWHLEALLGVGGMAAVYLATHRNNGKRVAVKMLHSELSVVSQIKARFLREGYASNKVNHPGVVSVLDDDISEDGCVFLVMELLEGENLEQRRAACGGQLDLQEVLWVVDQLLDVLISAHGVDVIHRDIKPENLFLTKSASLKVLDFGLARVRDPKTTAGLTRTNMLMGTLDFMSPEQARGKWDGVGVQSDIWSVGATMFMLLTGQPVHDESTLDAQLKVVATRPPRSIQLLRPDLPESVISLIDRALAFHPRDRWSDASSMQNAVRDAYNSLGGSQVPTTVRPPPVETPTVPTSTSSWESDLAQTQAINHVDEDPIFEPDLAQTQAIKPTTERTPFEDDAITRALPPLISLSSSPLVSSSSGRASPPAPPTPELSAKPALALPSAPSPAALPSALGSATPEPTTTVVRSFSYPFVHSIFQKDRRTLSLILISFPLWILLFWGLSSLKSCGESPAKESERPLFVISSNVQTEAPSVAAPLLSVPEPSPTPPQTVVPPAASSTTKKPHPPRRFSPKKRVPHPPH